MKVFVEGGGDTADLKAELRKGFKEFLEKAGLEGRMPRIVACGSRQDAYESFCTALENGETALLLVDSEVPVTTPNPWHHLQDADGWNLPAGATNDHCHLMVQCMEAWFLADRNALSTFFGQGFTLNALPPLGNPLEQIPKVDVYRALATATQSCKTKAAYGKGAHSFKLLARIDPNAVTAASPWAKRFIDELDKQTR
ncbi:MAG: DUF4276 family protein [Magnetococcales bacterium]|nr:DUF4276 family protein [Magnetococcales bacterium]